MKLIWKSAELRDYTVEHLCTVLNANEDGRIAVSVQPAIPGHLYGESSDIDLILLSPRYKGSSIVPLSKSPLTVNVWLRKGSPDSNELRLADIAKVYEARVAP